MIDGYTLGYIICGALVFVAFLISLICQAKVDSAFKKYNNVNSSLNMTGAQLADALANRNGLNVVVRTTPGHLSDFYNPKDRSVNISEVNYNSTSIASHAVIAHEFGHAMQDNQGYFPYKIRQAVVKTSGFISKLLIPLLIIGIIMEIFLIAGGGAIVIYVSAGIYLVALIANIVTLPVEFNASARAKKVLFAMGADSKEEKKATRKVLNAAAMTYVAAMFVSLVYFLRFLFLILRMVDRKR